jgi:iron complex transport system permease protein
VALINIIGVIILVVLARELNILTLGDEKALSLGVDAKTTRKILFVISSFLTGACVSAAGIIGFVGLIVPHIMRRITGPDHTFLLPASALGGAIFLTLSDTLAKTVLYPMELPVGVITGLLGSGFLLVFLLKAKRW